MTKHRYYFLSIILFFSLYGYSNNSYNQNPINEKGKFCKFCAIGIKESAFSYEVTSFSSKIKAKYEIPFFIVINNQQVQNIKNYKDSLIQLSANKNYILAVFSMKNQEFVIHGEGKYTQLNDAFDSISANNSVRLDSASFITGISTVLGNIEKVLVNYAEAEKNTMLRNRLFNILIFSLTFLVAFVSGRITFRRVNKKYARLIFGVLWLSVNIEAYFLSHNFGTYFFINLVGFMLFFISIPTGKSLVKHDNYDPDDMELEQILTDKWD